MRTHRRLIGAAAAVVLALALSATPARAHCDTMNGPVVKAAQQALELGDVTPVLRWVPPTDEAAIRSAFAEALAVRKLGPQAKALADRYFFETLVRIHRAGEGEPYTGLKPADTPVDPAVAASDEALARGNADAVTKMVTSKVSEGIQHRFERAAALQAKADTSVEVGREFVEAYVLFTHYVEAVYQAAEGPAGHGATAHAEPAAAGHGHVK